jgi:biopolymer transport protein ExbD
VPWLVRPEGSPRSVEVPSGQAVLDGLLGGDFQPTDEVRGPADERWQMIEGHPQFAEIVEEMDQPPRVEVDDSKLDMNPLIDVALVLLIFFILTTTYSSLRRVIELPPGPPDDKGGRKEVIKQEDVQSKSFLFRVWLEDGRTLFKLEDKALMPDEIERAMIDHVRATGRKELLLDVATGVEWGEITRVYDAAKAAEVHVVNRLYKK